MVALLNKRNYDYKLKILSNSLTNLESYSKSIEFVLKRTGSKDLLDCPKYDLVFGSKFILRCLSHQSCFINSRESSVKMEFVYIRDSFLRAHLYDTITGIEYEQATFCQINTTTNVIQLFVNLPFKHKNYHLSIDYGNLNFCYECYASFLISSFNISGNSCNPDFKYVDLKVYEDLDTPVYLSEPLSQRLKRNHTIVFKIMAQNAESVWLERVIDAENKERINLERDKEEPSNWSLSTVFEEKCHLVLNISKKNPNGSLYIYHYCDYDVID